MNSSDNSLTNTNKSPDAVPQDEVIGLFYVSKPFFWRSAGMLLLMVFYCVAPWILKMPALFGNLLYVTVLILGSGYSIYNLMSCRIPYVIYGKTFIRVLNKRVDFDQISFLDNQAKAQFIVHYKPKEVQAPGKFQDARAYIFWSRFSPEDQQKLRRLLEGLMHERAQKA